MIRSVDGRHLLLDKVTTTNLSWLNYLKHKTEENLMKQAADYIKAKYTAKNT